MDLPGPHTSVLEYASVSPHARSEEHTSELQSQSNLVCRLLLEKKKKNHRNRHARTRAGSPTATRPPAPFNPAPGRHPVAPSRLHLTPRRKCRPLTRGRRLLSPD